MNQLKEIATVFRKEKTDYLELSETIQEYKKVVSELSKFEIDDDANKQDLHFENGKALGASWAAMCMYDLMRTKIFIKGIFSAIEQIKKSRTGIINILYAGTGPFATLVLPIMATYSKEEVQFTFMEINKESANQVMSLITKLGFSGYVKEIVNEDASKYVLDPNLRIDIVISETMQRALEREQQVPIMMNLMNQLDKNTIMIPENISIDLCLMNFEKLLERDSSTQKEDYCHRLGNIFDFNIQNIKEYTSTVEEKDGVLLFPESSHYIDKKLLTNFNQLCLLTEIQVFGENKITINESGLTTPLMLQEISTEQKSLDLTIRYKIDNEPKFTYEWI